MKQSTAAALVLLARRHSTIRIYDLCDARGTSVHRYRNNSAEIEAVKWNAEEKRSLKQAYYLENFRGFLVSAV